MTARLVLPRDAAARVADVVAEVWAAAVCAERGLHAPVPITVRLSPGVRSGADIATLGFGRCHEWEQDWAAVVAAQIRGIEVAFKRVSVERVARVVPKELVARDVDAALALLRELGVVPPAIDVERARQVADALLAHGATLTSATLTAACALADADVEVMASALRWLGEHPVATGWTARQLPVPDMDTKWLGKHGTLLTALAGRDVRDEVGPRLAVVHLTYVDPGYLAAGGRRHDAWTTGDDHDPAYVPRTVLVVENRDCRLWFPQVESAIVVEGGGKAVASMLAIVPWIRHADVVYWGDVDADGYAILDHLRAVLARPDDGGTSCEVRSILMDGDALAHYAHLGVARDRKGNPIGPSSAHLARLTDGERAAYYAIATAGPVEVRRIEQERIPIADAAAALVGER